MKIWVDDIRKSPEGYEWLKTVSDVCFYCELFYKDNKLNIEEISLDHDAGDLVRYGGDYINILNWLEEKQYVYGWNIPTIFSFHSANPVGVANMKRICEKNNWVMK